MVPLAHWKLFWKGIALPPERIQGVLRNHLGLDAVDAPDADADGSRDAVDGLS